MRFLAIIQARMGSTRLPGKMLESIKGKPLLGHVIIRVKQAKNIDDIILATTKQPDDDLLAKKAAKYGIKTFRGSESDVLDRFYQCAKKFNAENIVRITGDCPLIDPNIIDRVIELFIDNELDYASNVLPPTYPDGLDVEVFSFKALERAWREAGLKSEREHVTPYIWKNDKLFKRMTLKNKDDLSDMRLTVDEREDLVVVGNILELLDAEDFTLDDLVKIIKENPEILQINREIKRNEGYIKSLRGDNDEKQSV